MKIKGNEGSWTRRFVTLRERAEEYIQIYRNLGYEVRVEPNTPEDLPSPECIDCTLPRCQDCVVIYTRPLGSDKAPDSDSSHN